jgi:hypothetical protein
MEEERIVGSHWRSGNSDRRSRYRGMESIPGTLFAGLFVLFVPNVAEQFAIHPSDR